MADEGFDRIEITRREELRAWLAANHATSPGVWVVTFKKAAGGDRWVPIDALIEELLAYGWIDNVNRRVDDERTSLRCVRRRPSSSWGARNALRAQRMIDEGLMQPPGMAAIEDARARGVWPAV